MVVWWWVRACVAVVVCACVRARVMWCDAAWRGGGGGWVGRLRRCAVAVGARACAGRWRRQRARVGRWPDGPSRARVEHIWYEWNSWGDWRAAVADALGPRASSRSSSQSSSSPAPARARSARDRRSRAPGGVWERLGGAGSAGGRSGLRRGSSEGRIPCVFTVPK